MASENSNSRSRSPIVKILNAIKLKRKEFVSGLESDKLDCTTNSQSKMESQTFRKKEKKSFHECQSCQKRFKLKISFEKHKKKYPGHHKFFTCCRKLEIISGDKHTCKKQVISKNNSENETHKSSKLKKQDLKVDAEKKEKSKKSVLNTSIQSTENVENNIEVSNCDPDIQVNSTIKDETANEIKDETDSYNLEMEEYNLSIETDSEPDIFQEVFKKQKRGSKRKIHTNVESSSPIKTVSCNECAKVFDSQSSLNYHLKVTHFKGKFKCAICEENFGTKNDYQNHNTLHGPEDKVICKGCKKVFVTLRLYLLHAKQYPNKHCYLCKFCLRKFPSELLLEQHVCICINGKPFLCGCGQEFTKYIDVITHAKGTKPFYCCSCPHKSVSLTAHLRHMRKHSKQKPFECTKCDSTFAVIDFLNIHMKRSHPEQDIASQTDIKIESTLSSLIYSCSVCNMKFSVKDEYTEHVESHNERIPCPDCGKLLKKNRLESHRNTHKASASLCPECGKLFDTRFKLTQHIITTHNSEPVKCEVCDKVLKTKKIFNEHMKTHMKTEVGERIPQAICPMCGLGLAQKGSLARHILLMHEKHKIVNNDVPHECKECGEICPNKGKYYSHRRKHRAMVDRFPCELCGRVFNKKQNLRRHIYLLHDERRIIEDPIYECQVCTRSFREKKNLRRHYKMVHKIDDLV